MYMPAAPTDATASLLILPIQIISVRLYAIWTRDVAIIGRASLVSDGKTGPFSKSIFCLICNPPFVKALLQSGLVAEYLHFIIKGCKIL